MRQVLLTSWLSHWRVFCLPRGVVGAGHVRGNLLNRRRHGSLGAGGGAFSTQKVEKAGRRRSFARRQVRMRADMSASGAKKPFRAPSRKGLAIGSDNPGLCKHPNGGSVYQFRNGSTQASQYSRANFCAAAISAGDIDSAIRSFECLACASP